MSTWQPTATFSALQKRADILRQIRDFFAARHVLEVDTPLLSSATVTDPYVTGIPALFKQDGLPEQTVYLQTSPEYAMKRLLAAGSGSIFQVCKAFRQGDLGRVHQPEFTMLEWYRVGFNHQDLMDEMDELLQTILKTPTAERSTYAELFERYVGINPHTASLSELIQCAHDQKIALYSDSNSNSEKMLSQVAARDMWLSLLLTHCIEPQMGHEKPMFVYDFPVTQAALAKIRDRETPPVASRFEVYFKGLELANGFHELQDSEEQKKRFEADIEYRKQHHLPVMAMDENFLAALNAGLPACAGVALGVDRLVMIALGVKSIDDAVSFGWG